jgi:hypothetical protein
MAPPPRWSIPGWPAPRPDGRAGPAFAALVRVLQPATAARRKDKYLTHFDYLRRLDRPSPLDYLGLTCSGQPLAANIAAFRTVAKAKAEA